MGLNGDGAADTLLTADGPELLEGSGAVDGGLVVACGLQNVVCAIVDCDGALDLSSRRRVIGAIGFDNVVLDKRVAGPAVHGNVRVNILSVPGTAVREGLGSARVSSLASYKVVHVVPLYAVLAARAIVVSNLSLAISPEGIEVAVVNTSSRLGRASAQTGCLMAGLCIENETERRGDDRRGAAKSKQEG